MKKRDLKRLALLGLTSGIIIANQSFADPYSEDFSDNGYYIDQPEGMFSPNGCAGLTASRDVSDNDPNNGNLNYHVLTEEELLLELNDKGRAMYQNLDDDGKKLAIKVASQMCNGTNECSGLNACQTDKNKCAGQGSCKGQSKCAISDKNLAVKLVSEKMAKKRKALEN